MQWENAMESYLEFLCQQERADATVQKYRHDIKLFMHWCDERTLSALTRESVMAWRKHQEELYAPATVNAAVAAVNGFLGHIGKGECCVKLLRVQHTPLSGAPAGIDPARVFPSGKSSGKGLTADSSCFRSDLRHGHPR